MIELTVVIVVCSIMAGGIAAIFIPQLNSYFHLVANTTLQSTAADTMKIIVEGDSAGRGLRFADPASPITAATGNSLTYQYYDLYQTAGETPHTIQISYDAANRVVSRTVDGGPASYIPYFATPGGNIHTDPLETDFFQYYDSAGNQLTEPVNVANVEQVRIALETSYAGGAVQFAGAKTRLKTGVFIKRNE